MWCFLQIPSTYFTSFLGAMELESIMESTTPFPNAQILWFAGVSPANVVSMANAMSGCTHSTAVLAPRSPGSSWTVFARYNGVWVSPRSSFAASSIM